MSVTFEQVSGRSQSAPLPPQGQTLRVPAIVRQQKHCDCVSHCEFLEATDTDTETPGTQTPPASQHSQCIQFHACHTQVKEWKSSVDLSCCLGIVIDVGCDTGYCSTAHQSKFCFLFHCYVSYAWHHVILGENLKHVLVVGKWSDPKEAKQNLAQFRDVFEDIYLEPKKEPSYIMI